MTLSGCDYGVECQDDPYKVQWIDISSNRSLVYDLGNDASIGRVNATIIAVGSSQDYIVAKQYDDIRKEINYYYIDRKKDHKYYNWDQITEGPFSEVRFKELKTELGLPDFSKKF